MHILRSGLIEREETPEGLKARVQIQEANGDAYEVGCIFRTDGTTDLYLDADEAAYLAERYGEHTLLELARVALT